MSHDYRPSSGAYTRPESPRRPTPILDPLPPRPPSASSSRLNTPRAPSPSPPSPNRLPALNHSMASLNSPPSVDMTEQMGNWLQTNMPPALQASLNNWCNAHAQPLLSGFLEQWMALNSQQLLQQELSRHLVPMQQALQQQQHMIGELQQTVTSQAAHIATLEASLAGVKKQVDAIPPPSAASAATAAAAASEPTPFTPTLPFQVGGSPVQPIHHPATSAIQSSQSLSPSATMGLGPRGVRPPSASSSRAVAFRDHEDGVGQSIDPKEKLRQSMTNGLARGLLGSVTAAGPGETYAGSEPQTRGAIRVHGSGARSKATGPIDIIVVDDLELARKIAHATLTKSHFKVELAADGLQAIELYKQYMGTGLKAVLMDIHLPGISGIETTERIRKIEQEAGIPPALIYGLTGDVGEDDLAKYKACGMNGCILKGKLLADAVKTAIEESSNGVQFVNLCDRQNGSSSSSSSAAAASSNASSASSTPPTSSGSQSSTISNLPHASPAERLRAEASGSPPGVFGTPRAPQPRAILMDKHGGARGSVKPGIGLGRDASSSGNSPTMSTQDRIMVTPSTNGPDLLLVEDVRVSRQIAMKSLKKMGFNVVEAESGEQAVDKFKQHTQTLKYIIMDINLPGISGIEATESIRSFEKSSGGGVDGGVIILGLTGNVDAESMHNYEVAGMNGCILKGNVLTNVLQQAIKEAQEGKFVNIS